MKNTILKGLHRPIKFPAFFSPMGFLCKNKEHTIKRTVKFDDSCAYTIDPSKQADWNKLFGVCFGALGIHKNSIRFGWRYNISKNAIELCTIVYKKGEKPSREYIVDCDVNFENKFNIEIKFKRNDGKTVTATFFVNGNQIYSTDLNNIRCLFYFGCGFYFGGKTAAPHKLWAYIDK